MAKTLYLVIPGLLGPWTVEPGFPLPQSFALQRLLSRAAVQSAFQGLEASLFALFGLPPDPDATDLPVAAVTRLADAGTTDDSWWLRADPVHLRADLHQILLVDARVLDISFTEAQTLVAEFNQIFAAEGWSLKMVHPNRWYLRLEQDPGIRTHPLIAAIGQDIHPLLPFGKSSQRWHTLLTEVQMLFHHSLVNQQREACGQALINSVWFWGGGALPDKVGFSGDGIYGTDPLVRGLARLADSAVSPAPESAADWRLAAADEAECLVVLEHTRYDRVSDDPYAWSEHVQILEQDWFAPCLQSLQERSLEALYLYPCNGRAYHLTPGGLRRFWRRQRSLADYL